MDPEINETILRLAYEGLRAKYPALNLADIEKKYSTKDPRDLRDMRYQVQNNAGALGRDGEVWEKMYANPRQSSGFGRGH